MGRPSKPWCVNCNETPASDRVMHIDFMRVRADRAVEVPVPLRFLNEDNCVGVLSGGNISHNLIEVQVSCLPANLPEFIEVDVGNLEMGEALHLTDLTVPEGVTIVALAYGTERDITVVSVQTPRGGAEEDEEEQPADGLEADAPDAAEGETAPEPE